MRWFIERERVAPGRDVQPRDFPVAQVRAEHDDTAAVGQRLENGFLAPNLVNGATYLLPRPVPDKAHFRGELSRRAEGSPREPIPLAGIEFRKGYRHVSLRDASRGPPEEPQQPAETTADHPACPQGQPGADAQKKKYEAGFHDGSIGTLSRTVYYAPFF